MCPLRDMKPTGKYVIPAPHWTMNEGKDAATSAEEEVTSAAGP